MYCQESGRWVNNSNIFIFLLGGVIGRGANSVVYKGLNNRNGKLIAVKEIDLSNKKYTSEEMAELNNEIDILKTLNHENIVKYLGVEKNGNYLYLFSEFISGGSLELMLKSFHFMESLVHSHTIQLLKGLKYLHDHEILHSDVKVGNILVVRILY